MTSAADQDLTDRLVGLVRTLRGKGIAAGPSETVDAAAAVNVLGLHNREQLREGLAASLVRRHSQRPVFDMTFDLWFPLGVATAPVATDLSGELDATALRELIAAALAAGDRHQLERLAQIAVEHLGMVGPRDRPTGSWSAYQTLEQLRPRSLVAHAERMRAAASSGSAVPELASSEQVHAAFEALRAMLGTEARRRTAEVRGRELVAEYSVRRDTETVDFLNASRAELTELRRQVRPLARRLASRLAARRRRSRRGHIDVRRTLRTSLSTGGVPIRPVWVRPRPGRPDLVLLCDVSGSVAGFSDFTMHLVQALSDEFTRVRVFAFVNLTAEVTQMAAQDTDDLADRIARQAAVTSWHTGSDYGAAFASFCEAHLEAIGPRTTVLILGDARNNNYDPGVAVLEQISHRARRIVWLNPEPRVRWGYGDSIAPVYAEIVGMHECRNVEQLSRFVGRLLPV